ncbi:hypothetical protein V1264_016418 [Littorina saxatilis]|uniref:Uncharacterized protein n=1 Tax=Littorina saxatilis TaxID=31220 RepID=A0AAN9BP87_9CAEN
MNSVNKLALLNSNSTGPDLGGGGGGGWGVGGGSWVPDPPPPLGHPMYLSEKRKNKVDILSSSPNSLSLFGLLKLFQIMNNIKSTTACPPRYKSIIIGHKSSHTLHYH